MTGRKPLATPIRADTDQGMILLDHDAGLAATLTLEAAERSAKAIKVAIKAARKKSDSKH
jgi:hypothetical protein